MWFAQQRGGGGARSIREKELVLHIRRINRGRGKTKKEKPKGGFNTKARRQEGPYFFPFGGWF